eukprot:scaffold42954_cov74-Phaeocystis_antarctica.AAC.12
MPPGEGSQLQNPHVVPVAENALACEATNHASKGKCNVVHTVAASVHPLRLAPHPRLVGRTACAEVACHGSERPCRASRVPTAIAPAHRERVEAATRARIAAHRACSTGSRPTCKLGAAQPEAARIITGTVSSFGRLGAGSRTLEPNTSCAAYVCVHRSDGAHDERHKIVAARRDATSTSGRNGEGVIVRQTTLHDQTGGCSLHCARATRAAVPGAPAEKPALQSRGILRKRRVRR